MDKSVIFILSVATAINAFGQAERGDSTLNDDEKIQLNEISVIGESHNMHQMTNSQNIVMENRQFIERNFSGSLMQSLSSIPGVKAMTIGSGQSKPTIRGLGFNRMAVTDNGIKHESQQWGDDHGLEIDQFAIDRVEVVKGPATLLYGSDAMGGVINLFSDSIPQKTIGGRINLFGRTNNLSTGISMGLDGRKNGFYYRLNTTLVSYADYQVPTDSIQYYSYYIKLKNRQLRNTAGRDYNGRLTLGYLGKNINSAVIISNVFSKSGFFADAHGLEVRLSDIDYDRHRRDIDLPYFTVNHLMIANKTTYKAGVTNLTGSFAYQNNYRRELSEPVSHGYMPTPPNSLERQFVKNTYSANIGIQTLLNEKHSLNGGLNIEYQQNTIGGWGFIIPNFRTISAGLYAFDRYHLMPNLIISAGIRYDYANTNISQYQDWYKTPVENSDSVFKIRSSNMDRRFNSFTWSAGIDYNCGSWIFKANIGKSFRIPIAKELGADGVNYSIFRYEKGNPTLSPEESYQVDGGIFWNNDNLNIEFTPYINYFPNYIYMNPTPNYVEGLQEYDYTQCRVLRYGFEGQVSYNFLKSFVASIGGEYLYARQKSGEKKGYTLPFSTPWSMDVALKYSLPPKTRCNITATWHIVGSQNEIVPPEKPTKGYQLLSMSIGKSFDFNGIQLFATLRGDNLLGKRYFDHTSYYRLIDVPEPDRNFSLMISLHF